MPEYTYVHFHDLPDGRVEAVEYADANATTVSRRQIVRREGVDDPLSGKASLSEYTCEVCRNWGNGTETAIEWAKPVG